MPLRSSTAEMTHGARQVLLIVIVIGRLLRRFPFFAAMCHWEQVRAALSGSDCVAISPVPQRWRSPRRRRDRSFRFCGGLSSR